MGGKKKPKRPKVKKGKKEKKEKKEEKKEKRKKKIMSSTSSNTESYYGSEIEIEDISDEEMEENEDTFLKGSRWVIGIFITLFYCTFISILIVISIMSMVSQVGSERDSGSITIYSNQSTIIQTSIYSIINNDDDEDDLWTCNAKCINCPSSPWRYECTCEKRTHLKRYAESICKRWCIEYCQLIECSDIGFLTCFSRF